MLSGALYELSIFKNYKDTKKCNAITDAATMRRGISAQGFSRNIRCNVSSLEEVLWRDSLWRSVLHADWA